MSFKKNVDYLKQLVFDFKTNYKNDDYIKISFLAVL